MAARTTDPSTDGSGAARLRAELDDARRRVDELQAQYDELLADPDVIQEDRDATALLLGAARSAFETAEAAVRRLDDGTYGRCEVCDEPIPSERLVAVPDASRCVACSS